ncbi:MAG: hypothetical protein F2745_04245 [Actinobacteria bacterium]|uniref:Unannotated protein n=1 Tax=freshwater metagenome TaxID=449393 RepID=A0A6J6PIH1_9ZZZZ|nr:hypothetical protein [Actinomycetota bacterium]MSZ85835.1 hypothetical protein [Actinomycetota bacterium]MTA48335.1 hypothetical protein [Actinomycetota bacterium]
MKRALLIAGGTVGGLGAVLSITPPQLGSGTSGGLAGMQSGAMTNSGTVAGTSATQVAPVSATSASSPAHTSTPSASASASATTVKKQKVTARKAQSVATTAQVQTQTPTASPTQSQTPTPAATPTQSQTPTPTPTPSKATPKGASGTFVGTNVYVQYGYVQVQLTVENGKITDARALQAPNGRSDRFTQYAIPILRQQTLNAQSSRIQGASGASYTSWGWYTSLQAALVKAGM